MKRIIFCFCFMFQVVNASDDWMKENVYKKLEEANRKAKEETWFKEVIKKRLSESGQFDLEKIKSRTQKILSKSKPCNQNVKVQDEFNFYILMTFELSDHIWEEYSSDLQKVNGVFVVQGFPNDSFTEFAQKIKELRKKGVYAPIQLNPILFEKLNTDRAPQIALMDGDKCDKITGSVSIRYALEQFSSSGDVQKAEELLNKLN